ncbi:hypothetical protein VE03_07429 [Pseudogymnoascus sp. 23342-1-I1]|nr:hypothetical protein VE03_07429 [Pseudogymnoascus sp. 23342-1-I1]
MALVVLAPISDEYGPFLYHFTKRGKLDDVIRPPNALILERNGTVDFASNNSPIYNSSQIPNPENPNSSRNNNQGFKGLTYNTYAAINDGALDKAKNQYTRLLEYKINNKGCRQNSNRKPEASEILFLGNGRFLVLSRDSSASRSADRTESVYRNADIFSICDATNINGKFDDYTSSFAPSGVLSPKVKAAEYCPFINFNIQTKLNKFSIINGGSDNDAKGLLNEKWEGLSLVPV